MRVLLGSTQADPRCFSRNSGVCAGLFLKKGLKLIAFFLGAVFIIMQVSLGVALLNQPGASC